MTNQMPVSFRADLPLDRLRGPTVSWTLINQGQQGGVATLDVAVFPPTNDPGGQDPLNAGGFPSRHSVRPGERFTATFGLYPTGSWGEDRAFPITGKPLEVVVVLRGGPSWGELREHARARGVITLLVDTPGQQPAAFSIGQPVQIILGSGVGTRGLIADLFYDPDDERWNYILEEAEVEPGTGQLAGTGRLLQGLWPEFVLQAL